MGQKHFIRLMKKRVLPLFGLSLAVLISGTFAVLSQDYKTPAATPAASQTIFPQNATPEQLLSVQSNGYALKDYENFFKEWPLVTVRYREDTGEIRLTYANELALKGLNEGKGVYEDGAVFAKIGFMSEPDPGFASSLSPLGARRYQLMIKDSKKHPEADGWGYALFVANGPGGIPIGEFPDPHACHACHKLVPERGFVFSIPMTLNPKEPMSDLQLIHAGQTAPNLEFLTVDKKKLSPELQKLIPGQWLRMMESLSQDKVFAGTLQEVPPFMIRDIFVHNLPALFLAQDRLSYVLIQPDPHSENATCKTPEGREGLMLLSRRVNPPSPVKPDEHPVPGKLPVSVDRGPFETRFCATRENL
jgi:hypothetical protein